MRIGELINAMRASRELGRKWYSSSGIAKELFVGYWNDMTLLGRRGRGGKEGKANRLFMQKKKTQNRTMILVMAGVSARISCLHKRSSVDHSKCASKYLVENSSVDF
jgi:hypothetical protein